MAKNSRPSGKPKAPVAKTPAKSAAKPVSKPKAAAAAPAAKKPVAKPAAVKPTPKAPAKPAPKAPAKPVAKGAPTSPPAPAKTGKAVEPSAKAGSPAPAAAASAANGKKPGPKGITIVSNKPVRKPKQKVIEMPVSEPLLKPGNKWKPLIPSGPKAPPSSGIPGQISPAEFKPDPKAKLARKDLDKYREILLRKRSELVGDVSNMEEEALRQNSGSLSSLPQHMAEQGSDNFDQSLSLDLAQVDRNLIREIDDALRRIEEGTYGVCLRTGRRISAERLAEIPWAKYSIEAAREMERRPAAVSTQTPSFDD